MNANVIRLLDHIGWPEQRNLEIPWQSSAAGRFVGQPAPEVFTRLRMRHSLGLPPSQRATLRHQCEFATPKRPVYCIYCLIFEYAYVHKHYTYPLNTHCAHFRVKQSTNLLTTSGTSQVCAEFHALVILNNS